MRFGLALPHYDSSYAGRPASFEAVARVAQLAERAGFDSVWVSDHLFLDYAKYGGSAEPRGALECLTTLSALAAVTKRVRLGSLTLCNDLRNPALVAKTAATIDRLSGGRLDLGVGAGWYEPEFAAAGIPFDPPGVRIARLGEALEIMRRMLSGEDLHFSGRFYTLKGALCRPGPVQTPHPPLWVGGKGDRLLATAARFADGWNYSWLGDPSAYAARAQAADRACEACGRDPGSLRRSVGAYVLAGRDEADARRRFERLAERTPEGILRGASGGGGVGWEEFRSRNPAGTVAQVVDRLGELRRFGVEEVVLTLGAVPFQLGDEEDVELVAQEVLPALR